MRLRAKTEPGSRTGCDAGIAQSLESFFGDGLEVVGGRGSEFGGQGGAGAGTKLLGVDAKAEAMLLRSSKDGAVFVDGEGVIVAEGVAIARESGVWRLQG